MRCTATRSLIVNLAREIGADYLVRGLRGASDIEDEITLAHLNAQLAPEITTLFVPAEQRLSEVSSSRLKELVAAGEEVSAYCTAEVERRLAQRIQASSACSRARAS